MTDRELLAGMWDDMSKSYTWIPAWSKSFADLTPQQAAWKPSADRNSIWQHLNHICFWREVTIRRLQNEPPSEAEVAKCNFEQPSDVSLAGWQAAQQRLMKSHELIRAALTNEKVPVEKLKYLLPHDAYHLGQVMLLRGLQNLPPVGYD